MPKLNSNTPLAELPLDTDDVHTPEPDDAEEDGKNWAEDTENYWDSVGNYGPDCS